MISISKAPAEATRSGWYEILPRGPAPRALEHHLCADWVIVGAGFAGLTAAHRIVSKRPEDTVVVLDAQPVGWGASGRNSGFIIDLPHHLQSSDYSGNNDQREIRQNRFAIDYVRDMVSEFGLEQQVSER